MTKQEIIREGIESRLSSLLMVRGEPPQEARETAKGLTKAWFEWLDSQGVVIKVDGERHPLIKWYAVVESLVKK